MSIDDATSPEDLLEVCQFDLGIEPNVGPLPRFDRPLTVTARSVRLLTELPWARGLGQLEPTIRTQGWKFPAPPIESLPRAKPESEAITLEPALAPAKPESEATPPEPVLAPDLPDLPPIEPRKPSRLRPRPTADTVVFKDRLLYLLQPPIDDLFRGKQVEVPFQPFPYQLEGIAFLMPRNAALLADEMGLGKTMQTILAIRLLLQAGLVRRVLLICPKPLVFNWKRELELWAADLPHEIISGDANTRRSSWLVTNTPLKLINYETLTRDEAFLREEQAQFDLVVLDEAQRIKNRNSKTAQVVKSIRRERSWALSGTPIENRPEDLLNLFDFIDPNRIPEETPAREIPRLTADCILRRTKEDACSEMPPKLYRDICLEMTPAQLESYELAEKEGVVRLNELGDTISVQHVFQLVMRLKQICNFDPLTMQSAKLEQLLADMVEVAENDRKAIIFSQWVEPLRILAGALEAFGPLEFHGKIPSAERPGILDRFKADPTKHVLLMSYGTGSVGLNLQFTNYVFLFDRWWNPAIEDQAINRAHRIGQQHPVTVTRFTTENTIEQRIAEILEVKRQLFAEMLARNDPPPTIGLSEEEIFGLFDIRSRPRKSTGG